MTIPVSSASRVQDDMELTERERRSGLSAAIMLSPRGFGTLRSRPRKGR